MDVSYTTFYIVRHGQSEHNLTNLMGTLPNAKLTPKGESQAKDLAQELKNTHFDLVVSSDFLRTKQTAEIIALEKKLEVQTSQALRERSYGRLNGRTEKEIQDELQELYTKYSALSNKDKFTAKLVDDMESTVEAQTRAITYLKELAIAYPGKTILVVSHNTILRSLLIHLRFADHHEIDRDCIANTAYFVMDCDGENFALKETFGITKKPSTTPIANST